MKIASFFPPLYPTAFDPDSFSKSFGPSPERRIYILAAHLFKLDTATYILSFNGRVLITLSKTGLLSGEDPTTHRPLFSSFPFTGAWKMTRDGGHLILESGFIINLTSGTINQEET